MSQITATQTFVKSLLTSWICIMCNLFDNQNMLPFSSWRVMIVSFQASVRPSCHWQWMERTQFIILAQRSKWLRRACDVLSWPWCHHVTSQKSHGIARGSRYEPGHPYCLTESPVLGETLPMCGCPSLSWVCFHAASCLQPQNGSYFIQVGS